MTGKTKRTSVHSIIVLVLILLYPVIAYISIDNLGIRMASILVLVLLFGSTLVKILATRSLWGPLLLQTAAVAVILGAGFLMEDPFYMKLVPTFIAVSAAFNFFFSLRKTPIIESFARMQKPELRPEEIAYTRRVTHLWGWTMVVDAAVCMIAAVQHNLRLWLILCFPVSYVLIGLVFCCEYVYRKWRFGEFDEALVWDKILKAVLGK